jgi:hypothetical protein
MFRLPHVWTCVKMDVLDRQAERRGTADIGKHTFAGFGLCFAPIAETALTLDYMSSNEVYSPQN